MTPPPAAKPTLPYRWTNGHADKAREAAAAAFGETHLKPGDYLWAPTIPAEGDTKVVVDLLTQTAFVYRGEDVVGMTTISSGKKGRETPLGFWSVLSKKRMYRSRKYDSAPMPFAQMIDDHGIALHGGKLPGYPASHGCVRLPMAFAERLFNLTKTGSKVIIEG
ncbi:MAG: L,D-transpeptidase family protein [Sphingomicrobium sp.]